MYDKQITDFNLFMDFQIMTKYVICPVLLFNMPFHQFDAKNV